MLEEQVSKDASFIVLLCPAFALKVATLVAESEQEVTLESLVLYLDFALRCTWEHYAAGMSTFKCARWRKARGEHLFRHRGTPWPHVIVLSDGENRIAAKMDL